MIFSIVNAVSHHSLRCTQIYPCSSDYLFIFLDNTAESSLPIKTHPETFITMFAIIMIMVILKREREMRDLRNLGRWIYICGRRKTGKTFFVKRFMDYDVYFFVNRDGSVFTEDGRKLSYETFFELFREMLGKRRIVLDEMHRLPPEFFDFLHSQSKKGEIIAISSTLWLSQRLLGSGSPLLGLFSLYVFGLVDECDVVKSLDIEDPVELLQSAAYLREPMLAYEYTPPIEEYLSNYLYANRLTLKEIIGEIFSEEKRRISRVYEGILRAISDGKRKSTEISSYLFSNKLIPKDNPGAIQRYLDVLVKIGLIEKIEMYTRGYYYDHRSPLFDLHFYLDEKYGYTEFETPPDYIKRVVKEMIPWHIEKFVWNLLANRYGLQKVKILNPEIDIALKRFSKLEIVGEVKWRKNIPKKDLINVCDRLSRFKCRKILIVQNKESVDLKNRDVEIMDVKDIIDICRGSV